MSRIPLFTLDVVNQTIKGRKADQLHKRLRRLTCRSLLG